jgi:hypothetical protein
LRQPEQGSPGGDHLRSPLDVEVTEDGQVDRVKNKESLPVDHAMESCMASAIEGMRVPRYVVEALIQDVEKGDESSRRLVANPLVLGGAISLLPAVLVAAEVTVVVAVTISLSKDIIDAARRRRKAKARCLNMFVECQGMGPPCTDKIIGTLDVCGLCRDECQAGKPYTRNECYRCGFQ